MLAYFLMTLLFILAVFLIVLVLVQRGKGGGLAGALGGMGGQSAFGTKAGDLFTRITIGVAAVWIVLCIISVKVLTYSDNQINLPGGGAAKSADSTPAGGKEGRKGTESSSSAPASSETPAGGGSSAPASSGDKAPAEK